MTRHKAAVRVGNICHHATKRDVSITPSLATEAASSSLSSTKVRGEAVVTTCWLLLSRALVLLPVHIAHTFFSCERVARPGLPGNVQILLVKLLRTRNIPCAQPWFPLVPFASHADASRSVTMHTLHPHNHRNHPLPGQATFQT